MGDDDVRGEVGGKCLVTLDDGEEAAAAAAGEKDKQEGALWRRRCPAVCFWRFYPRGGGGEKGKKKSVI